MPGNHNGGRFVPGNHPPNKTSLSKREDICALRKRGLIISAIVNQVSCAKSTVEKILKEEGLTGARRSDRTSADKEALICKMRLDGWSRKEIMVEVGVSKNCVYKCLKRAGLIEERKTTIADTQSVGSGYDPTEYYGFSVRGNHRTPVGIEGIGMNWLDL